MSPAPANFRIALGVVLLAAGASTRMGRPKLLLPWADTTVLGRLLTQWRELGAAQIAVVGPPDHAALTAELARLARPEIQFLTNPAPERGMFSSVQCAAHWREWNPALTHWAVSLGDQPQVATATLRALLAFAAAHPLEICQPGRQGRRRHPVIFPVPAFRELASTGAPTLKQFLLPRADLAVCELDDAGLDVDLDTPEDYEQARARFHATP